MYKKAISLILFIVIILLISSTLGYLSSSHINTWYSTLKHPSFSPPNWVFGPVWTILYILIATSAWKVYIKDKLIKGTLTIFLIQMLLNFSWTVLFFNYHKIGFALVEMTILWLFIIWNMFAFKKIDQVSFYLFIPYILWVSFAWVLNLSYWLLN